MYSVVSDDVDGGGKHIVRVVLNGERTCIFKFATSPTQEQVDNAVAVMLESEERIRQEEDERRQLQAEIDAIIENALG